MFSIFWNYWRDLIGRSGTSVQQSQSLCTFVHVHFEWFHKGLHFIRSMCPLIMRCLTVALCVIVVQSDRLVQVILQGFLKSGSLQQWCILFANSVLDFLCSSVHIDLFMDFMECGPHCTFSCLQLLWCAIHSWPVVIFRLVWHDSWVVLCFLFYQMTHEKPKMRKGIGELVVKNS